MYKSFKDYVLDESVNDILRTEFPDVIFNLEEHKDFYVLNIVVVKHDKKKQGLGSKFLHRLIEIAEHNHKDIFLSPDDSYAEKGDMNKKQLEKWYKSFGFVKKHPDDKRDRNLMVYYV